MLKDSVLHCKALQGHPNTNQEAANQLLTAQHKPRRHTSRCCSFAWACRHNSCCYRHIIGLLHTRAAAAHTLTQTCCCPCSTKRRQKRRHILSSSPHLQLRLALLGSEEDDEEDQQQQQNPHSPEQLHGLHGPTGRPLRLLHRSVRLHAAVVPASN
jgi:hypothetical protein